MEPKPVDPNNEGHSKAHAEAFNALIERIGKALQKPKPDHPIERKGGLFSHTHINLPKLRLDR